MACSPLRAARSVSVPGIRGRLEPELAACIVSPGKKRVAVTRSVKTLFNIIKYYYYLTLPEIIKNYDYTLSTIIENYY